MDRHDTEKRSIALGGIEAGPGSTFDLNGADIVHEAGAPRLFIPEGATAFVTESPAGSCICINCTVEYVHEDNPSGFRPFHPTRQPE